MGKGMHKRHYIDFVVIEERIGEVVLDGKTLRDMLLNLNQYMVMAKVKIRSLSAYVANFGKMKILGRFMKTSLSFTF